MKVTLKSDCLGCELARGEERGGWGGGGGGSELIAHIRVIQVLPVADSWIDEDGLIRPRT